MIVYSPANKQVSAVSHLKEALQSLPVVPAPGQSARESPRESPESPFSPPYLWTSI